MAIANSLGCTVLSLIFVAVSAWPTYVTAGDAAQVDLSVDVALEPAYFEPGGEGTFTVTVHNAGPDPAGASNPGLGGIVVFGNDFVVTAQPPPFELVGFIEGECYIDRYLSEPLPDGSIVLAFDYYFGSIPPGESRSCVSGIQFHPSTVAMFDTSWRVYTANDVDIDPKNDAFAYQFRPAPQGTSIAVPAASISTQILLAALTGLLGSCALLFPRNGRSTFDHFRCYWNLLGGRLRGL